MEKGFTYTQASIITNEVYRGLVEGYSYDLALGRAFAHPDF
jgi:hypothetical protein